MDARSTKNPVEPDSSGPSCAPTPATRSVGPGGGPTVAPAARSGVVARVAALKKNPWFAVATRGAAIVAGMLGLAAIGATSTLAGAGVPVALPRSSAAPLVSGVWIAPDNPTAKSAAAASPSAGSSAAPAGGAATNGSSAPPTGAGLTADGKVILNAATADELMKLPRVGAKRAQAILDLRHKLGHFQRATDLLRVRGIGHKMLKQIVPLVVIDAPAKP